MLSSLVCYNKAMKRGENPLYPESNGEGLIGAYAEAAFIDDTKEMFSKKKTPVQAAKKSSISNKNLASNDSVIVTNFSDSTGNSRNTEFYPTLASRYQAYRRFSKEISQQSKALKEKRKLLKKELKSGQISHHAYRKQKRALARHTDHANWQCYLKYLKGDFYD